MRKIGALFAVLCGLGLTGCGSVTVPASGVTSTGEKFTGSATASVSAGTFEMTGSSGAKCSGTYDQFSTVKRMTIPFTCSNGKRGTLEIIRNNDLRGGKGTASFSDGSTGNFVFGKGPTS